MKGTHKKISSLGLWFMLFVALSVRAQETYIDNFNVVANNNNNGTQNWATVWIEVEPHVTGNTIANGYVRITGNRLRFHWLWDETIKRSADLLAYESATLSFDWQTSSLETGETLSVQISDNADTGWVTLATFGGNTTGVFTMDISAYISTATTVRFLNTGTFWTASNDQAFIDNITITAQTINTANFMRHGKFFNVSGEREMKF